MAERALATAFVNIVPGTKDFESKLKSQLSGEMPGIGATAGKGFSTGFGGSLKKLIGPALAAVSVGAIAAFGKETILLAEDVEVANNRLDQIAKSMGVFGKDTEAVTGRLKEYAEANELVFAQDAEVIKSTQAKLLTFKNLALTADEAGGSFDRATAAAFDLAAAGFGSAESNAVQLGKALQDPIKGLTALGRSGVTFTEAEKARITTLVESNKVGEAQELVLAAIEAQVGGTAAATAKASERMKLGFESVKEGIGGLLLPAFQSFTDKMTTSVFPAIQGFIGQIKEKGLGPALQDLAKNIFNSITAFVEGGGIQNLITSFIAIRQKIIDALVTSLPGVIQQIANALVTAIPGIVQALLSMIPHLLETALQVFNALVKAVVKVVPMVIQAIVDMLPKLVNTLTDMIPKIIQGALDLFLGLVQGLVRAIPKLLMAWYDAVPKILTAIVKMLPVVIEAATELFIGLVEGLAKILPKLIRTLVDQVIPKFIETMIKVLPLLIEAAVTLFTAIIEGLAKATPAIIKAIRELIPVIIEALIKMMPLLIKAGVEIVKGLVKGILDNAPTLIGAAMESIGDLIINSFKSILGIASPSKVFIGFGKDILKGLEKGLLSGESGIKSTMKEVATWVTDQVKSGDLPKAVGNAAKALVKTYRAELLQLNREHERVIQQLEDAQDRLAERLQEKADFISGLTKDYSARLQIDEETTAEAAIQGLRDRIAKTRELRSITAQLLSMGLNQDLYRQIIESQSVDFARSILEGGTAAVQELNVLSGEANAQANQLAEQVGGVLFDQGISFAQSIVDGLEAQEYKLAEVMERVADAFADRLTAIIDNGLQDPGGKTYKGTRPGPDHDGTFKGEIWHGPNNSWKWDGSKWKKLPKLAKGGFVDSPTTAIIGEAGPEVVTPLKDFERMVGLDKGGNGKTINYYAAPNASLNSERALFQAIKRAEVIAGW